MSDADRARIRDMARRSPVHAMIGHAIAVHTEVSAG
jgi:hypothetical protein